jgi:hypothetical protein
MTDRLPDRSQWTVTLKARPRTGPPRAAKNVGELGLNLPALEAHRTTPPSIYKIGEEARRMRKLERFAEAFFEQINAEHRHRLNDDSCT